MCVSELPITGSDNGWSPTQRQTITWTNNGIFLSRTLVEHQLNINRNSWIFIQENAFENGVWKMVNILSRPFCANVRELLPNNNTSQNNWNQTAMQYNSAEPCAYAWG